MWISCGLLMISTVRLIMLSRIDDGGRGGRGFGFGGEK